MNSRGYKEEVKRRVHGMSAGTVFVLTDFADIAGSDSVRQTLKAQVDAGTIDRVLPGVFLKPKMSTVLGEPVPPHPDDVAHAIARANKWSITPGGQVALNALGLSTQVPMTWTYVSDGPYAAYSIRGAELRFKRSTNRNTTGLSETTSIVIQALKALGKDAIGETEITAISRRLSDTEKLALMRETERSTAWVREAIRRICDEA